MAIQKIKTGDTVVVMVGQDKQKKGKVLKKCGRHHAIVEGVNLIKKHVRPNPQKNEKGGILEREAPIHISNIAVYNAQTKKADRVGVKQVGDETARKRVRCFKSNNEIIDV
jgi:large subunit ribosomal protein L24